MSTGISFKLGLALSTVAALAYPLAPLLDPTLMMPLMFFAEVTASVGLAALLVGLLRVFSLAPMSRAFIAGLVLLLGPRNAWFGLDFLGFPLDGSMVVGHATIAASVIGTALAVYAVARAASEEQATRPAAQAVAA